MSDADTDLTDVDEFDTDDDGSDSDAPSPSDCQLPQQYYREHAQVVSKSEVAEADYADSSSNSLDRMEKLWHLYCEHVKWVPAFDGLTLDDISSFLRWKLRRKRDENGRKLRGL
ncbi:hypothetical protein BDY21DRAFT_355730 [Lineolata rhizophorae]|uniref:Uncharacterized protein n=1 Tax=Lineolata rhizophorae TaxID=578093 RepID=A0A6A6NPT3_9PEZI|nr:hypothetical protein BDY21DRAFT_355730 [Lineolata rhizophorae]